jgi:hypothetical protein
MGSTARLRPSYGPKDDSFTDRTSAKRQSPISRSQSHDSDEMNVDVIRSEWNGVAFVQLLADSERRRFRPVVRCLYGVALGL